MGVRNINSRGSVALVVASVSVLLVLALGGWYATWRHYHYGGSTAACSAANLHLSIGTSDGTAGTQYTHVVVTNQGDVSCQLTGYPAVFLTDSSNNALGNGAAPNPLNAPQAVTLAPGKMAHAVVGFPDHNNFSSPNQCGAASTNLELFVPSATTALNTPFVEYNCPGVSMTAFDAGQ